jgi:hypothetical protein
MLLFFVVTGCLQGQGTEGGGLFRLLSVQAERTQSVAKQQVQAGHLILFFDAGKVTRLMANGLEVGLYFQGEGRYRYLSVDAADHTLFAKNAMTLLKSQVLPVEGGAQLEGKFERVILWTRNVKTELQGEFDAVPTKEAFARDLEVCEKLYCTSYIHEYANHEFNAATKPFAFALLFLPGRKGPQLVYDLDSATSFREDLVYLRLPHQNEHPVPRVTQLSRAARGWDFRQPIAPSFQLRHLDLDLTAPGGNALESKVEETLLPQMEGQRVFSMGLRSHRFFRAKNGSWPELTQKVIGLEDASGKAIPFLLKHDLLTFVMPQAMPKGLSFTIRCQVKGNILVPEMGDDNWRLDAGDCFPSPEVFCPGAFYTVKARVRTRAPWVPIVGGVTTSRRQEGGFNVVEGRLDQPVGMYTILGAEYKLREQTREGQTVRLAMYGTESQIADQLINLSFGIIKYYEYLLGPFPFKEFTIVQDNSYGRGQAPPGLMIITNEAFGLAGNDWDRLFRSYFSNGINQRFAHEIAHQYWAHLAKEPNFEEQWLSEAFAQYCSALTMNVVKSRLKTNYDTAQELSRVHARRFSNDITIPMANYFSCGEDDTWTYQSMRAALIYEKGSVLLGALRKEIGDDALVRVFRAMLFADPWGVRTTDEFITLLNQATGKDWHPWFERFYYGTEMP